MFVLLELFSNLSILTICLYKGFCMKIKILIINILLLLLGCNLLNQNFGNSKEEEAGFTLSISSEARTVTPTISMDITSYEISGVGPTTSFAPESSSTSSYTKSGLEIGEWTITVNGKNSSGDVIATGSGTVTLVSGTDSSITIDISPVSGTGSFSYEITWPDGSLDSPVVNASFGVSGGTLNPVTFTVGSTSATLTESNLTNGYYTLILDILDGTSPRTSIVETVRIVSGNLTEANFSFNAEELSMDGTAPVQLSIEPGEYGSSQSLTLSSGTSGATIKFTNNGSVPTETTGIEYTGSIAINSTQTIRAMAFADGYNNSSVTSADYTITGSVPLPKVQLDEGLYYTEQSLLFTVPTGDYTVVYTTDGSTPSLSPLQGSVYSNSTAITLSTHTTYNFKAKVFNTGNPSISSDEITANYQITDVVADPVFGIASDTYNSNQTLSMTTTMGASIYYTIDGSEPSKSNGTLYTGDITIDGTTTIKAIAVKDRWQSSSVVSSTYTLMPVAPSFNLTGGTYNIEKSVSLTTTSGDCSIFYTLDGSNPTSSSTFYTGAITITQNSTLKAVSIPNNSSWSNSAVISESYTLKPLIPTFSIEPNTYSDASFTVDFLCDNPDVTFVYTIDETVPVLDSNGYTGSSRFIAVDTKLKVIASKIGWDDSEVLSGEFYPNSSIVSPENGDFIGSSLELNFPGTIDSTKYWVRIYTDEGLTTLLEEDSNLKSNNYTITQSLTSGSTYYWVYQSFDGSSWSNNSLTYNFIETPDIGDSYGGGILFYLDGNGGGLIAAPSDQSTGIQWYNGSYITIGATGTSIGTGQSNTNAIIAAQGAGSYAAQLCADLVLNGYDDWFLPSKDELNQMYMNRAVIGGFSTSDYWSSSEYDGYDAWLHYFDNGARYDVKKDRTVYVRAIRAI